MLNSPFSPWPSYSDSEVDAVAEVIRSGRVNYWTGSHGRAFEEEYASWVGASHAVALANGTVALEAALAALGIGPGDEVVVTPRTFIGSVSPIVLAGAVPVFADIDRDSQNVTAETIEAVLSARTRAIICVHLGGWPCDMKPIRELAALHGLAVIEDCAQAHGATYAGASVGTLGDIGAWSFCQDKIITTGGEGGMITTNSEHLWESVWSRKDHGKNWDAVFAKDHPPGFRWVHESFGTNWRLTEAQAAIGRLQLKKLDEWRRRRSLIAGRILDACAGIGGLRAPRPGAGMEHAWYRCYVFVEPAQLASGWNRDRVILEINERGVPCMAGSCSEVYKERAFANQPVNALPVARELGQTSIAFLTHPTLTDAEVAKTCDVIRDVMGTAVS